MPTTSLVCTLKSLLASDSQMVALMASLRRVSRWHCNNFNAVLDAFIFQEITQLVERPTVRPSSFCQRASLLVGTFSNARQVLNGNNRGRRQGILDNVFADVMVEPGLIASFFPRQPLQQSPASSARTACAFRGLALNRLSCFGVFVSNLLNGFAVPFLPLARYCNVSASKVNANHVVRFSRFWRFVFELDVDVVLPVSVLAQLSRGWRSTFEFTLLIVAKAQLNALTATQQGQADGPILFSKRKDAGIIICTRWTESLDGLPFELGSLTISSNPSAYSNRLIGAQSKLFSQGLIHQTLNRGFACHRWFDSLIGVVATIRKRVKQSIDFSALLKCRLKFANKR